MTNEFKGFEYNILGCPIRLKEGEENIEKAKLAVDIVNKEVESIKIKSPHLSNTDIAVLVALKVASDKIDLDGDFKKSLGSLKFGIKEAINFLEDAPENQSNP